MPQKKIFLIAGEASGDLQGALLIRALKQQNPELSFRGLGGPLMAEAGMELTYELTRESVLGATDVLKKYFFFRSLFERTFREVLNDRPDAVILIDYPGFNIRFAKRLNRRFPVYYYVSPQIWAWAKRRIHTIKKFVTHMLVFFQFEETLYKRHQVPVTWVGHPLVDKVLPSKPKSELRRQWWPGQPAEAKYITLFAGSRETEVKRILPEMLRAAEILHRQIPETLFLISQSTNVRPEIYEDILIRFGAAIPFRRIEGRGYDLLFAADLAFVASGTATLETMISETPFLIFYKTAALTFWLGRMLIDIPYIGLVNVIAGKKIVPEFLQNEICHAEIAREAQILLQDNVARDRMTADLRAAKSRLGSGGAADRAAKVIAETIGR